MDLVDEIYTITKRKGLAGDFDLRKQIIRAAVSIPANIAEGDELHTNKQAVKHFYIARGSAAELRTHISIARRQGYIPEDIETSLDEKLKKISGMLYKLIKAREK